MKRSQSILLFLFTFLIFSTTANAQQLWSGVLSPARATNWTYAGVSGGIPSSSWTQCVTTACNTVSSAGTSATAAQIVSALNSAPANSYVLLGPGTYNLSSGISLTGKSNVELRGSGANSTILAFSGGATFGGVGTCMICFQSSDSSYGASTSLTGVNWTAGYPQGGTSITLSSGANITANSTMLVLDQCDTGYSGAPCSGVSTDNGGFFNCGDAYTAISGCSVNGADTGFARPHRFQAEIVQATSCNPSCGSSGPTTVTITPPLIHPNWASGQTPQAWLIQPVQKVGVRNLTITESSASITTGIAFFNAANVWAQGVAVQHAHQIGIWLWDVSHASILDNYVVDTGQNYTYTDPYGIKDSLGAYNLFQNNIIQSSRMAIVTGEGPAVGDVVGYNFSVNQFTASDFVWGAFWAGHANGDDYNLYEGNVADQLMFDQIHGTHLMITAYRNFFTGWESCANGNCGSYPAKAAGTSAIDDLSYNRYMNALANVLGTPGVTVNYAYTAAGTAGYYSNSLSAFNIGSGNGAASILEDPLTLTTAYRWGNWDVANGATQWNPLEVPSAIPLFSNAVPTTSCTSSLHCPASFYLSGKPSWFGSIPFPPIGPDVTGGNVGQCTGTLNTAGKYNGLPATSGSQCGGSPLATTAWAGHVYANPAMACYLNVMGGSPDGTPATATYSFNASTCYSTGSSGGPPPPAAPSNLSAIVQ